MAKKLFISIFVTFSSMIFAADDITGFWKSLDDNGKAQCIFGVYKHEGRYFGKIIGTYNKNGEMDDTIYEPIKQSQGVVGTPNTCGLDILHSLVDTGPRFVGKIMDPSKGKTYKCEMWREGENLILRGKLFIFGKNISWYPVSEEDFPEGFELPDLENLTPDVPTPN